MLNEFFLLDSSPPGQRGMTDSLLVGFREYVGQTTVIHSVAKNLRYFVGQ